MYERPTLPPIEFFMDSSKTTLQNMQLSSMDRASRLGKAVKEEMRQWVEQEAFAMMIEWMITHRETIIEKLRSIDIQENAKEGLLSSFDDFRARKSA